MLRFDSFGPQHELQHYATWAAGGVVPMAGQHTLSLSLHLSIDEECGEMVALTAASPAGDAVQEPCVLQNGEEEFYAYIVLSRDCSSSAILPLFSNLSSSASRRPAWEDW